MTARLSDSPGLSANGLAVILISKSQVEGAGATGVGFVARALSRALSAVGGELDVLASRRAYARSALLVAAARKGEPNRGLVLASNDDDTLPGSLRRALDRLERVGVPIQFGEESKDSTSTVLGELDVDAVSVSLPVIGNGEPLELVSALDLHYAATGLASWFAP